mmetsp:Transcript_30505/g.79897  ORF Transcript_30505/g.79897 Transcript_30505/m.79897 type:complete len:243 (-) Transcript_30505:78-806(-)
MSFNDSILCSTAKKNYNGVGRKCDIGLRKIRGEVFDKETLFKMLQSLTKNKALIGAGTRGRDQGKATAQHGLVQGHAYSVLSAREISLEDGGLLDAVTHFGSGPDKTVRLVQLRNPWGSFEWDGAWGDKDKNWTKFKNVAKKLKHGKEDDDDGVFWMPYDEFWDRFGQIDLCDRSTGFGDLALDIDEAKGFCGPARGCAWGCFKYWCMCKMCRASAFGHIGGEPVLEGPGLRKQYFSQVTQI